MNARLNWTMLGIVLTAVTLAACESNGASDSNPVVSPVMLIDGCQVKFVDRGSVYKSFWLARCGTTSVVSGVSSSGKSTWPNVTVVDSVDAAQLEKEKQAAIRQEKYANARAKFEQLSQEERDLLGIKTPAK